MFSPGYQTSRRHDARDVWATLSIVGMVIAGIVLMVAPWWLPVFETLLLAGYLYIFKEDIDAYLHIRHVKDMWAEFERTGRDADK